MNHFLLPKPAADDDQPAGRLMRYGSYSIERLLNGVIANGGRRDRLEVKVFGGANVGAAKNEIGQANVEFVRKYFQREGIKISASDLGGSMPRRVRYFPVTGRAQVLQTESESDKRIFSREQGLFEFAGSTQQKGVVEIFDLRRSR
jgi:chemotaxis protein CheD